MSGSETTLRESRQGTNVFAGKDKPSKVGDNKTGFLPGLSDAEDFELAPGKAEAGGHL